MTWDCDGVVITNFVVHLSNTFPATMLHLHTCQLHAHSVIALQENRKQSKWRHKGTYEHGPYSGHFYSHTRHHCFLVRPVWSLPVSPLPTLLFSSLRGPAKFVPCHYYGQMVWAPISCRFFLKRMKQRWTKFFNYVFLLLLLEDHPMHRNDWLLWMPLDGWSQIYQGSKTFWHNPLRGCAQGWLW